MRSTIAQAGIAATRAAVWAALTSPACTQQYFAGLSIRSAWHADACVEASHGGTPVATGTVVVADEPAHLVYRLDEPVHQDVACWLAWHLEEAGPGVTRVPLTADTLPCDPPVDAGALLSSLKCYLERPQSPASPLLQRTLLRARGGRGRSHRRHTVSGA